MTQSWADLRQLPISEIGMSVRLTSKLELNGIETVADLVNLTDSDLADNLGLDSHSLECVSNVMKLVRSTRSRVYRKRIGAI